MKPACLIALLALMVAPGVASAKAKHPFGATVGTSLSFNQANFADLGGGDDSGWVVGTLRASIFYAPPVKGLNVFGGVNVQRALRESFARASVGGSVPVQPYQTQISDANLGASYRIGKTGPVVHVVSGSLVLPISNVSQATGLITRFSPSYTAQLVLPGSVSWSNSIGGSINALEEPTIQLDCGRFRNLCEVRGGAGGLAAPNNRGSINLSTSLNWQTPLPGLGFNVGYFWSNGISAVRFDGGPASSVAQDGVQTTGDVHGTSFRLTLAPALIGIKAPPPGVPLASLQGSREPRAIDAFIFSMGMQTFGRMYTNDNKRIRNPLFDTESNTGGRTLYFFSVTARL